MNQDRVSAALDQVLGEISAVHQQLTAEVTAAFSESRLDDVSRITATTKRLFQLRAKLEQLSEEWTAGTDSEPRQRASAPSYSIPSHSKGAQTRLSVRMSSGQVISRATAAQTFVDVLQAFGLENVEKLQLTLNRELLVSKTPSRAYQQTRAGSYFVMTHSNTAKKQQLLEDIALRLRQSITVDIV